jgi:PadR family transcriptional regulator
MPRKRSHETRLVLQVLIDAPADKTYGLEVTRATGLSPGSVYTILRRLEDEGLLDGSTEGIDPVEEGRPARYYYELNAVGRRVAHAETRQQRAALRSLVPGWGAP